MRTGTELLVVESKRLRWQHGRSCFSTGNGVIFVFFQDIFSILYLNLECSDGTPVVT